MSGKSMHRVMVAVAVALGSLALGGYSAAEELGDDKGIDHSLR